MVTHIAVCARSGWVALALAVAAVIGIWLQSIDGLSFSNDAAYALGTGFRLVPDDAFLQRFHDAALAACPADDAKWCRPYQGLILSDLVYNYPIAASFGRGIAVGDDAPFILAASGAVLKAAATGLALALVLFLVASAALPPVLRLALGILLVVSALAGLFGRPTGVPQLDLGTSMTWPRIALTGGGLAGLALAGRLRAASQLASLVRSEAARLPVSWLAVAGAATLLLVLAGRILLAGQLPVLVLGTAAFLALIAAACVMARTGVVAGLTLALVLFLLIGPNVFFWLVTQPAPRCGIFLISASLLAYVAHRPNGRLVVLLPLFCLFHISVAGLIATVLFLGEAVVCLSQRRPTVLLAVSAAVAIGARLYVSSNFVGFGAGLDAATILSEIARSDRLAPGAIFATAIAAAGLYLVTRRGPRWLPCGRALLWIAGAAGLGQVAPILDLAGHTFFEPGLTAIILAFSYLAPALTLSGVLVILGALAAPAPGGAAPGSGAAGTAAALAILAVALLAAVRVEGRGVAPADWARGAGAGLAQLVAGRAQPNHTADPLVTRLRAGDDHYLLRSHFNPRNDPIIYLSLLKYKVRAAAGLFEPARAIIETVDGSLPENRPGGATP